MRRLVLALSQVICPPSTFPHLSRDHGTMLVLFMFFSVSWQS